MIKWNEAVSDRADGDLMIRINREQDDEFCRKLRAALWAGKETCPVGVSTEPGRKKPILNYRRRKDGVPVDPGPWWAVNEGQNVRG